MSDLKPCPFCGAAAFYRGFSGGTPFKAVGWVQCSACEAKGPARQDEISAEPAAAGAWNRVALGNEVLRLREALQSAVAGTQRAAGLIRRNHPKLAENLYELSAVCRAALSAAEQRGDGT